MSRAMGPDAAAATKGWRLVLLFLVLGLAGCKGEREDPRTVVMLIQSSPNSLDPRVGTDAYSERIGGLLFDALVRKDEHFEMQPWLATSWTQPDALTWVFHLRDAVRFADGRALEAEDVRYTITSLLDGSLATSKAGTLAAIDKVETPDRLTVVLRLKRPDASLLFNLSDGLFGVVPRGSGKDLGQSPVGSGAFKFVRARQDQDVVITRNPGYWAGPPKLERVRFQVVPDAVTVALELRKGSADIASNELTLDLVHALEGMPGLQVESSAGSPVMYLNFNVAGGMGKTLVTEASNPLHDVRIRQAIAFAMDRQAIVHAVWRDQARLATSLLPTGHWAAADPAKVAQYPHDVAKARALLAAAGYKPGALHLEMKTSQDETTRLLALILQQQLADAGIELTLRASEFGTFYADVSSGRFQMYALRWIGSNEDPAIFEYALGSDRFPPKGANRGRYSNATVDGLMARAGMLTDENSRRPAYAEVQQILATEVPVIPLWYPNNEVVHRARVMGIHPALDGSFWFLRDAWLR